MWYIEAFEISPYYNPLAPNITANNMVGMGRLQTTPAQPADLGIPIQFCRNDDVSPWGPINLKEDASYAETPAANFLTPEAVVQSTPPSSGSSSYSGNRSSSPRSPEIKMEKAPSPIRRIKGSKIQKNRAEPESKFVIMTPMIINDAATGGKPNPFECFEAMRTTHRGRKGPLADKVKESALQVRRLGACFCCHARKVKVCRQFLALGHAIFVCQRDTNMIRSSVTRRDRVGTATSSPLRCLRLYAGSSRTSCPFSSLVSPGSTLRRSRWPLSSAKTSNASW
jgi:hypothetical protein